MGQLPLLFDTFLYKPMEKYPKIGQKWPISRFGLSRPEGGSGPKKWPKEAKDPKKRIQMSGGGGSPRGGPWLGGPKRAPGRSNLRSEDLKYQKKEVYLIKK